VDIKQSVFLVLVVVTLGQLYCFEGAHNPRVTIITSLYKGGLFIEGFLEDIIKQTIFDECELLIINANSPDNETSIIEKYCDSHPNIRYIRLNYDPGLYGVWNIGIKLARAPYVTNANVDDRLEHTCYEKHAKFLDENQDIDLVYSDHYISNVPNENFCEAQNNKRGAWIFKDFSKQLALGACLPNNHPMWRVTVHDKVGFFDESFQSAGDWDLWIRTVMQGCLFKKIPQILGVFYINPKGLSRRKEHAKEVGQICKKYGIRILRGLI
jgi:glycosyltransferase involved in cell wall biosynthesis